MHKHGTKTTPVILPTDGETSWSLLPSLVSYYHAAQCNQKTPIPVSQGDRSGLGKPKKDQHQH